MRQGLITAIILSYCFTSNLVAEEKKSVEEVFTEIYNQAIWGANEQGEGYSGPGSTMASTVEYRGFLQNFLKEKGIRSVVDLGCGDWEFSQNMDWTGVQ